MSVTISLTSAVIVACASVSSMTVLQFMESYADKKDRKQKTESLETIFADASLLLKTLEAHGCCVKQISENDYTVDTAYGTMRYVRENIGEAFRLELGNISNPEEFLAQMRSFETEYGRNVQTYTYQHIKENLTDDMSVVSEEVLDDDSLLLTIEI